MKAKSILLFLSVLLLGCKGDKSEATEGTTPAQPIDNFFKVTLTLISPKNDTFSLFYTEDGTTDFTGEPISVDLGGMDTPQQVVYKLPEEAYPTQLRLDFGMNKEQPEITLQSILFEYKGNKKMISGTEIGQYFRADDSKCTFDPITGKIVAKEVNGQKQFPSLYPHEAIVSAELQNLAK